MQFTDTITAHKHEQHYTGLDVDHWEEKERQGIKARFCSYCGSLHPEDFYSLLNECDHAEFADMKYGYPHKIYLNFNNNAMLKFYLKHLIDITDQKTVDNILSRIYDRTEITLAYRVGDNK